MKHFFTISCLSLILITGFSQDYSNAPNYLSAIGNAHTEMNQKYMAYMSVAAHSRRARKIEKTRLQVIESINNCKYKTTDLPYFKGDNSLRKSSLDYIQLCFNVFNEDYAKIVNMEEIAEQSFSEMEAYILLQEATSEKLKQAGDSYENAERKFAKDNNINLIESKSELGEKMEIAGKLNKYFHKVYLVFFKCNWQDGVLTEALNNKKINEAEQARNSLIKYATEGLKALDSLRLFNGDPSLNQACKNALFTYKKMAETEVVKQTDYFLKLENFDKIKKAMEAKGDKTKEDITAYNKAVAEINKAVNESNQSNANANNQRNEIINNWNQTEKVFMDLHMPKHK